MVWIMSYHCQNDKNKNGVKKVIFLKMSRLSQHDQNLNGVNSESSFSKWP